MEATIIEQLVLEYNYTQLIYQEQSHMAMHTNSARCSPFLLLYRTYFQYGEDVTDATEEPPMCPQKLTYLFPPNSPQIKRYGNIPQSEECLYLSVYTPKVCITIIVIYLNASFRWIQVQTYL